MPGEVAERLKAPLSKSGILLTTGSWVRIPPSPSETAENFERQKRFFFNFSRYYIGRNWAN